MRMAKIYVHVGIYDLFDKFEFWQLKNDIETSILAVNLLAC
ncbi:putative uncharacterized protein [Parachlamydia acanthamoebae UV-7]|uniref:Uncharacterized protein n=1 Tax=Parachlamydia acanthamoebae (strain UV7) TaxID=765952 RepID=F8KZH8_PARAV|nr:hypothetical protein pah_c022o079 [Parachlamydia acanthamoebae str. Hall's coccus]CCB86318.1 putative uncharacterized protein [Parachlamydia acanthamoebae UV-7]